MRFYVFSFYDKYLLSFISFIIISSSVFQSSVKQNLEYYRSYQYIKILFFFFIAGMTQCSFLIPGSVKQNSVAVNR